MISRKSKKPDQSGHENNNETRVLAASWILSLCASATLTDYNIRASTGTHNESPRYRDYADYNVRTAHVQESRH